MDTQNEQFTSETVDEQIELLSLAYSKQQPVAVNTRIIHNLYGLNEKTYSSEQMRHSLDRIWERLLDSVAESTEISQHITPGNLQDATKPQADTATRKTHRSQRLADSRPGSLRRTFAVCMAAAVVIVNILGWTLLAQRLHPSSSGSSGRVTPTTTAGQLSTIKEQAVRMLKTFHQEVTQWGQSHTYYDAYDRKVYQLDYEYDQQGIGHDADIAVEHARTLQDYSAAINLIKNDLTNLKAMEADYNDKTPWNKAHATDTQLMNYYNIAGGRVIVVSLTEQTLRLYQDGKLIRAFSITSGRYEKPSLPGLWHIISRASPTLLTSDEPRESAFWYPVTRVNYAMHYHSGDYFLHDSWWRANYGPGTNFPHLDNGGDQSFAGDGSNGSINLALSEADWLYKNTANGDVVIIY